jgi:spoIIIJ-associated protein
VDEAVELALLELGVGRDEVAVDVLSRGRSGILGIGSEPAQVRVSLITSDSANARPGLGIVNDLLDLLDADANATIRSSGTGPEDPAIIDIEGEDAGLIIGRRGETLRSFQFVVNVILGHQQERPVPVVVDVEQYRERRERQLRGTAQRMAERAAASGRPVALEPMSPAERRIIHMALADDRSVTTASSGEGSGRHVVITPTGAASGRSGGGTHSGRRRRSGEGR